MKTGINHRPQGSVLLVTLATCVIIGIALAGYLSLVSHQNLATMRSLAWNSAIPVAEAGVEEALTQFHYNGITNLSANGWTALTNGWYFKKHSLDTSSYYEVAVKNVSPPVILSTGYVPAPLSSATASYLKRRIQVNTSPNSSLPGAMFAKGIIDFSGNNVATDGFDSSDPLYSTNGRYDPNPAKTKATGDVLTNARVVDAIEAGNADIKGHVATGPGGTVYVGSGGSVGDLAWVNIGKNGIEPGWSSDDMNADVPDVKEPFTGGYFTPGGGKVNKVNYKYILDQSVNYKLSTLSGAVLVKGNATLWVTGSVNIGSGEFIQIAPGASLKLYVSAASASIGGNGVINSTGSASSFQYFGLPSNTALDFKSNASFTGVVYAPEAAFSLGGGGTDIYDFVGACVVNTIKMNGHFHFHYDEALRKLVTTGYVVSAWNEVDPSAPLN